MHKMNKKGQGTGLTELFSGFFIFTVTFVFFILLNLPSCTDLPEQKISSETLGILAADYNINSYLQSRVEVEGHNVTMAEFIAMYKEDSTLQKKLLNKTKEMLSPVAGKCFGLCVDTKVFKFGECNNIVVSCTRSNVAKQTIPSREKPIKVALDFAPVYQRPQSGRVGA